MQDEPTPTELIKAVADFLRNEITPAISGHNAFKLRVAINALDLVTRQLALESRGDAAEAARLTQLLGMQGSLVDLNRALADRIAKGEADLQTPGLADHLWQTTMDKLAVDQPNYASYKRELERKSGLATAYPRHCERSESNPAFLLLMHGLLRFARNDGEKRVLPLLPQPFRRALFRKCLRALDVILRRRHRLYRRIVALLGYRLLQRYRKALLDRLLGGADRHRRVLADGLGPALGGRQRFACRHHLIDEIRVPCLRPPKRGARSGSCPWRASARSGAAAGARRRLAPRGRRAVRAGRRWHSRKR